MSDIDEEQYGLFDYFPLDIKDSMDPRTTLQILTFEQTVGYWMMIHFSPPMEETLSYKI